MSPEFVLSTQRKTQYGMRRLFCRPVHPFRGFVTAVYRGERDVRETRAGERRAGVGIRGGRRLVYAAGAAHGRLRERAAVLRH